MVRILARKAVITVIISQKNTSEATDLAYLCDPGESLVAYAWATQAEGRRVSVIRLMI